MNILPKKSWHVRSRQNIERVKRDEAQAAEEKKQRQERAALAEQEARTALLRRKTHQLSSGCDKLELELPSGPDHNEDLALQTVEDQDVRPKHVDLFSDLSTEKAKGEKNKEHEKEEKSAKEKYEKSIGLLTYLGQSSTEAQTTKPWYFKPPNRATATSAESEEQSCADSKRKASLDPMMEMEKYLGVKKSKGDRIHVAPTKSSTMQPTAVKTSSHNPISNKTDPRLHSKESPRKTSTDDRTTHRRHRTKHKHKHKQDKEKSKKSKERQDRHRDAAGMKEKRRRKEERDEKREEKEGRSLQQLREERLRREATERVRTNRLLAGEKMDSRGGREPEEPTEKPGRYNSQFHPELVRHRHHPSHYTVT